MEKAGKISISDHFTYRKILKFALSPILMMLFISLYSIVDGFFISNFAGPGGTPGIAEYSGVNLIMPVIMIIGGIGFMFGAGGSALVGKLLGEQNKERANKVFTMMVETTFVIGVVISIAIFFCVKPIAVAMGKLTNGTTQEMVDKAVEYGRILSLGQMFFMTQNVFQNFMVVAERQRLGFFFTLAAGVANMLLDLLFVAIFHWGVVGAAIATIVGYVIGSVCPFVFFLRNKNANIRFVLGRFEIKPVLRCCFNGMSEFVNNISMSIVGVVFNIQLLIYYGQDGVAAYGTIMYVSFLFIAIYIGYVISISPVISYNYGAQNKIELNSLLKKSMVIISICAIAMLLAGEFLGPLFAKAYVGSEPELLKLTTLAFRIFSISFLFSGFSIYFSNFFTALNNGLISAIISLIKNLILEIVFVFVLPIFMKEIGIWWSIPIADFCSCILSVIFLLAFNKKYGYIITKSVTLQSK